MAKFCLPHRYCFQWYQMWWLFQMRTGTMTTRITDRMRQRFLWYPILFSSDYYFWLCSGVWTKTISSHNLKMRKRVCNSLYICNIPRYNIIPKLRALVTQFTYFWKDWNIWFHGVILSELGTIIFWTCKKKAF